MRVLSWCCNHLVAGLREETGTGPLGRWYGWQTWNMGAWLCMMTSSNGNIFRVTVLVQGIHRSPANSPHKGQWRGALMFSLICAWIKGCVNNREAGDLRRHHAHYDVTVMKTFFGGGTNFYAICIKDTGSEHNCYYIWLCWIMFSNLKYRYVQSIIMLGNPILNKDKSDLDTVWMMKLKINVEYMRMENRYSSK